MNETDLWTSCPQVRKDIKLGGYNKKRLEQLEAWLDLFMRVPYAQKVMIFLNSYSKMSLSVSVKKEIRQKDINEAFFYGKLEQLTYINLLELATHEPVLILPVNNMLVIDALFKE